MKKVATFFCILVVFSFFRSFNQQKLQVGKFYLNLNFKHTGKYVDYDGGSVSVKSTNIANLNLTKSLFGNNYYLSITNLLNENYEKPATYSQDGRQLRFGFRKSY